MTRLEWLARDERGLLGRASALRANGSVKTSDEAWDLREESSVLQPGDPTKRQGAPASFWLDGRRVETV